MLVYTNAEENNFFIHKFNMLINLCLFGLNLNDVFAVMYRSIPKLPIPPPPLRANPGAFDFFEKNLSTSPLCCQFRWSNALPVRASKRVKSPTLQACLNRIAYLWKQVLHNFQPLQISLSACLRSTL